MNDSERIVLDFYDAFSRLDVERMLGYFTDGGIYEDRSVAIHPQGQEPLRAVFERFHRELARVFSIQPLKAASKDGLVFTERLDHFDLPPRHLAVPVASVIEVENGKIRHLREYWDRAASGLPFAAERLVLDFYEAWSRLDVDELLPYFAEDAVWHNIPSIPVTGQREIRFLLGWMFEDWGPEAKVRFDVSHITSRGSVVFTERVDNVDSQGRSLALPVTGVFEVEDGKIKQWRDYYDRQMYGEGMPQHTPFPVDRFMALREG